MSSTARTVIVTRREVERLFLEKRVASPFTRRLARSASRSFASRRIFAWYWAHEHRCVISQEPEARSGIWGRCIGHGGMPQSRRKTRVLPQAPEQNLADWRLAPARIEAGQVVAPPGLILEGRNPLIPKEGEKSTPHGYAVLTLDGPHLLEQVLDAEGGVIYEKRLASYSPLSPLREGRG